MEKIEKKKKRKRKKKKRDVPPGRIFIFFPLLLSLAPSAKKI
jgi:hypothetical protein